MSKKGIKIFLFILGMLLLNTSNIFSQAEIDIPITVSNNAPSPNSTPTFIGLDLTATDGLDVGLGEANLPPLPPAGVWDVRYDLGGGISSFRDYRNAPSYPFTGTKTHLLKWQQATGATTVTITYNMPVNSSLRIQDTFGGPILNVGPFTGSGSYTITNTSLTSVNLIVEYSAINPPVSGPIFNISPSSPLTIPPTAVGSSNSANVTVSNTGTAALDITSITSSNPEFTIAPTSATIPVGGNQVFVVTFTPTSLGNKTSNLVFTHNASGSPTTYVVNGVGADAGPTFSVTPTSLTFNTNQGVPVTQNVTVTNNGLTNALAISSVTASLPYSVSPTSANIPAGGSQVFAVTFSPTTGGSFPGSLVFTHNGTTSPDSVTLSGTAVSVFGLVFAQEDRYVKEDSSYTDIIQLKSLSQTTQAIQFRLLVNKSTGDNSIITFQSIEKGADIASNSNWSLQYEIYRGPITANGSSVDSIYVLLYNLQQNSGLPAGSYDSLLKVNYYVVDLPALVDTSKSSFKIDNAQGSTYQGAPVNITPSRDKFEVFVTNRASSLGDVNGDGSIDILDLINVVDHILGRDSLNASEFARANIAPWTVGAPAPTPDAFVNVQDLAVIQNIILTGYYPSGVALNKASFIATVDEKQLNKISSSAKVKLFITNAGIAVKLDSDIGIRGVQLEFKNVKTEIGNMLIDSRLGGGYYHQSGDLLRVLLYDQAGNAVINEGDNLVANMPFDLSDPKSVSINKIILVSINNQKIDDINVEIYYSNAPEIPVDYSLSQNFPNPFNPSTSIQFSVPKTGFVTIKVYDLIGQEVTTLFAGIAERGLYTLIWNGKDDNGNLVSSGSYIYRMSANDGGFVLSKKMTFLK
jgi:hypothetical protein